MEQHKDYAGYLTQAGPRIWVNAVGPPDLSAYNGESEPWRFLRLAQVADQMEEALPDRLFSAVFRLADHKGELTVLVHREASDSDIASIRFAANKAWALHNECSVEVEMASGKPISLTDLFE